jgi:hypothetical protein
MTIKPGLPPPRPRSASTIGTPTTPRPASPSTTRPSGPLSPSTSRPEIGRPGGPPQTRVSSGHGPMAPQLTRSLSFGSAKETQAQSQARLQARAHAVTEKASTAAEFAAVCKDIDILPQDQRDKPLAALAQRFESVSKSKTQPMSPTDIGTVGGNILKSLNRLPADAQLSSRVTKPMVSVLGAFNEAGRQRNEVEVAFDKKWGPQNKAFEEAQGPILNLQRQLLALPQASLTEDHIKLFGMANDELAKISDQFQPEFHAAKADINKQNEVAGDQGKALREGLNPLFKKPGTMNPETLGAVMDKCFQPQEKNSPQLTWACSQLPLLMTAAEKGSVKAESLTQLAVHANGPNGISNIKNSGDAEWGPYVANDMIGGALKQHGIDHDAPEHEGLKTTMDNLRGRLTQTQDGFAQQEENDKKAMSAA